MNIALKRRWTLDNFLAWEAKQERKYEFDGVQPVAMVGVTRAHGEDGVIDLPELGCDVPLAELYEGIEFEAGTDLGHDLSEANDAQTTLALALPGTATAHG